MNDRNKMSENEILLKTVKAFMSKDPLFRDEALSHAYRMLISYRMYKGDEIEYNFSHDNMTSIICLLKKYDPKMVSDFPLFGYHSVRPDNFLFYLRVKYPLLGIWLYWIPMLGMWLSAVRVMRTNKAGDEYEDTDGVQLAWVKMYAVRLPLTEYVMNYLVNKYRGGWLRTFTIYHNANEEIMKAINSYFK